MTVGLIIERYLSRRLVETLAVQPVQVRQVPGGSTLADDAVAEQQFRHPAAYPHQVFPGVTYAELIADQADQPQ